MERRDDGRVELRARPRVEERQRLLARPRAAIGAGRGEGVEDIADRDDPGEERDAVARQAVGVAGAVEPFMMGADTASSACSERILAIMV